MNLGQTPGMIDRLEITNEDKLKVREPVYDDIQSIVLLDTLPNMVLFDP